MIRWTVLLLVWSSLANAQSYAPAPGFPGSTAIHKDSSIIIDWASGCTVQRGPMDIQNVSLGLASYGFDVAGVGYADNDVVSLGDAGSAVLTFNAPIVNGPGPDFAVFENGFADHYIELAFVEVSSDGINFVRFDAISETPLDPQLSNFSFSNCGYVHNLAGKYRVEYGTPFDLQELAGIAGLNIDSITHVRLIDVVGSVNPSWGSYDSQGNLINDPYPTAFESSGFDVDAVAVLHSATQGLNEIRDETVKVYPNPSEGILFIETNYPLILHFSDASGREWLSIPVSGIQKIDVSRLKAGIYFIYDDIYGINQKLTIR